MGWLLKSLGHLLKTLLYAAWGAVSALFSCCSQRKTPDLSADVCLVTGAGQGLGRQLALQLAECGATLVLWDIDGEKVRAVAGEIREGGREAYPYVVDCSKKEDVYRVAEQVRDEVGDVAVLVNNAGILHTKNYVSGELSDEEILKSFSVNTLAHFWTVRAFLQWMVENDYGYIVNVASAAAFGGLPYMADYSATKASVRSFSESLRHELFRKGIKGISITCAFPITINTTMMTNVVSLAKLRKYRIPFLSPEDVSRAILNAMAEKMFFLVIPRVHLLWPVLTSVLPQVTYDVMVEQGAVLYEELTSHE